jgi:hypothetical protein
MYVEGRLIMAEETTANIKEVSPFFSDLPTAVQTFWEGITAPLFELSRLSLGSRDAPQRR